MITTKKFVNYFKREMPLSAFFLTALAAVLVITEGFFWIYNQALFAARFDAIDMLYHFGSGVMLILCAVLLLRQPPHNRVLGFSIGILALISLIAGGGFLVGFALGIIGGLLALTWNSNLRLIRAINNRLMKLTRKNRTMVFLAVAVIAILIVMPTELSYQLSMANIREQALSGSKLINTSHGLLEYTDVGEGYPVLVSHGAAMGYDMVESVRQMLGNESFRLISPSRFGYLRTPMPPDASFAAQADAFADLLDALNISKVIVMGFSFGGPAALQFVLRHPDRSSALVMSMAVSHNLPSNNAVNQIMFQAVFRSDFGIWLLSTGYRPAFLKILGVSSQVQDNMTDADEQYVDDLLRIMQPASARQAGLFNDLLRGQNEINLPIETINIPTIVFHSKEDGLVDFEYGQYTAQHIPNAKFVPFESGGHLLVGRLDAIHNEIMSFLREKQIVA
jgi:2-hydroxy-6-oxonona-2,4-dienedioate hydrolase